MAKIDNLFHLLHANHGSDLHLSAGNPPLLRIYGDLARVDAPVVTTEELLAVLREMVPMERVQAFEQTGDLDFAYEIPGLARYRANFFRQNRGISAVFREIPQRISTVEELGLPIMLRELALLPKGLVLVTGPTGSGKSTTLAALVDYANTKRRDHIITIEDPIEFVHQSKSCLVNQREIGRDSRSFGTALRSALREDPDIILVGEMRDLETISLALEAAETGHLLLSSLHTVGAAKTIDRIIDTFPASQQQQVRVQLSMVLRAVVSQRLVPTVDGTQTPVFEVMAVNPAIQNMIRDGKTFQIDNVIYGGAASQAMLSMDNELIRLAKEGRITREMAQLYAVNPDMLRKRL
mgnify:CR=1 FL=1